MLVRPSEMTGRASRTPSETAPRARIGCSGWNYPHWREVVYPKGLPPARWLEHYATLFDTVEVNSTFYQLPKRDSVARWVEQTPDGFVFTVKASRYLTHVKRLTDLGSGIERFYERIEPLVRSPKLGPVLWQLPANFRRDGERLGAALEALPAGRHCFEFRHESWFVDEVYKLAALARRGARHRRPPGAAVPDARADGGLDVHPFPLRTPRPERQLVGARARRMGAAHRELATRSRRVRVLQQRLARLRGQERPLVEAAARGLTHCYAR